MVHAKLIAREVFGIIGNVFSFGMFASSVPTFYRVIKNNSVEESKPEYFLLTMMNCFVWVLYGMPFINPGSILVQRLMALALLYTSLISSSTSSTPKTIDKGQICVGGLFLTELALVGLVSGLSMRLAHTYLMRTALVGAFGYFFSALMTIYRLSPVVTACAQKSVESMPFLVVLSSTLNDLCWLIYASLRFEIFLLVAYCSGFFVGVVQLVLYGVYYKSAPKSGDDKKLATAEVQLQGIGTGDDNKLAAVETQLQGIVIVMV